MDYITILDMPQWQPVAYSAAQAVVLYLLILIGLKLAGRRMFAEMDAQDFVVLLLVADAANLGLTHNDGGFWSSVASVGAIIGLGSVIDHIPLLRNLVDGKAVVLYAKGQLNDKKMKSFKITTDDLDETARQYGLESYRSFMTVVLEGDGSLTGTVRSPILSGKRV